MLPSNQPARLLNRPVLHPGESLSSYLARLASANYCEPPQTLWRLIVEKTEVEQEQQSNSNSENFQFPTSPDTYARLSALSSFPPAQLYRATAHRYANLLVSPLDKQYYLSRGEAHPVFPAEEEWPILLCGRDTSLVRPDKASQFCPACLEEESYHRLNWALYPVTACLTHQLLLITGCPNCQRPLSVPEVVLSKCNHCRFDLRRTPQISLAEDCLGLAWQQVLQSWLEPNAEINQVSSLPIPVVLPEQSPALLFQVLLGLVNAVDLTNEEWPFRHHPQLQTGQEGQKVRLELTSYADHCRYTTAFKGLSRWPQSFYEWLEAYREQEYWLEAPTTLKGLGQEFGKFYRNWLGTTWRHRAYYFVQNALNQYAFETFKFMHGVIYSKHYQSNKLLAACFPYIDVVEAGSLLKAKPIQVELISEAGLLTVYRSKDSYSYKGCASCKLLFKRTEVVKLAGSGKVKNYLEFLAIAEKQGISDRAGFLQIVVEKNYERYWLGK